MTADKKWEKKNSKQNSVEKRKRKIMGYLPLYHPLHDHL
jgi:hypothetical protein